MEIPYWSPLEQKNIFEKWSHSSCAHVCKQNIAESLISTMFFRWICGFCGLQTIMDNLGYSHLCAHLE
jgi:hypothetical protein